MDSERLQCVAYMVTFYKQKKHEQHATYPNANWDVILFFSPNQA
jgi:hypothetical protein